MRETISVRAHMSGILRRLQEGPCRFSSLFQPEQGVTYVVVNFIALLELAKEGLVRIVQPENYAEIEIHAQQASYDEAVLENGEEDWLDE